MAGAVRFFPCSIDGVVVSTELVLLSRHSAYSFLGGTLANAFAHRPNDLLKFEIIRWAKKRAKRYFVLGGGYQGEDGIFQYKQSFASKGQVPYFLGGQIFLPATV